MSILVSPYGGPLVNLVVDAGERQALLHHAASLPAIQISERAVCDLELLATGAFSPLDRFMSKADYEGVVHTMRLAAGQLFSIPITLPVADSPALRLDADVALTDRRNNILACMTIHEIYEWDRRAFASSVLGTADPLHPLVAELDAWGPRNISGPLRVVQLPRHLDFIDLRLTPEAARCSLERLGRPNVVAFQTRNPLHRAHEEMTRQAMDSIDGALLLHPVIGMTKAGDVDLHTRVRTYRALVARYYEPTRTLLAAVPLAMRFAGPREAVWHAIVRRNYGANHLIVGRDHAGPGLDSTGRPFYGPYDAQDLLERHRVELGVAPVPFKEYVYVPDEESYRESSSVAPGTRTTTLSGTEVRRDYLERGRRLPPWFTRPEVAAILGDAYPPRSRQGVCVWLTGLSGAGKTTVAELLEARLLEHGRQATMLDGDVVRTMLSKGLGFSKADRDLNILRIGFVAAEIVRHGGVAICAAVSPYRAARNAVREMLQAGHFAEVHVDAPLDVCEARDVKGLYAKARRGELQHFTGIDDPYEAPARPEVRLETARLSPEACVDVIVAYLVGQGFLPAAS